MMHVVQQKLESAYSFVRSVFKAFGEDRGMLFAAAIGFYGLLSLLPLMLLAIGVFGYVLGSEGALQRVISFAEYYIPMGTEQLEMNLRALSQESGALSGLGLLGLAWAGSQVFVTLQQVMSVALGAERRPGYILGRLSGLAMVIVTGALFVFSLGISSLLTAVRGFQLEIWGVGAGDVEPVWNILGVLIPVLISTLAFTIVYRLLPLRKIGERGPMIGGVTAGLLFEAAKYVFSWYVTSIASFGHIYGSLGGVVMLLLWIYYVSVITVLGAEVVSVYVQRYNCVEK